MDPDLPARARKLLPALDQVGDTVIELGALASPAVQVEPALLRRLRLQLASHLHAGVEADLWFSPLVTARGPDGIMLDPSKAEVLRRALRAGPTSLYEQARALIVEFHRHYPPELELEERIADLAARGEATAMIERELAAAVAALRRPERAGLAAWAAGALGRLPAAIAGTQTAWRLRREAQRRLPETATGAITQVAPGDLRIAGYTRDQVRALPRITLPVRRAGRYLEIGAIGPGSARSIPVPDTKPVLVEARRIGPDGVLIERQVLMLGEGERVWLRRDESIQLLTAYGQRYDFELTPSESEFIGRPRILFSGDYLSKDVLRGPMTPSSAAITRFLREHGHNLSETRLAAPTASQWDSCDLFIYLATGARTPIPLTTVPIGKTVIFAVPASATRDPVTANLHTIWRFDDGPEIAQEQLAELLHAVRSAAVVGELRDVPALPDDYVSIPVDARLLTLRKLVLDPSTPIAVIRGEPGLGKSVLAAAVARDEEVRAQFPGGIVWASFREGDAEIELTPGWEESLRARFTFNPSSGSHLPGMLIADAPLYATTSLGWSKVLGPTSKILLIATAPAQTSTSVPAGVLPATPWPREEVARYFRDDPALSGSASDEIDVLARRLAHNPAGLRLARGLMIDGVSIGEILRWLTERHNPGAEALSLEGDLGLVSCAIEPWKNRESARDRFVELCVFTPARDLSEARLLRFWRNAMGQLALPPTEDGELRRDLSTLVERGLLEAAGGCYRVPRLSALWLERHCLDGDPKPGDWHSHIQMNYSEFHRALAKALNPEGASWPEMERLADVGAFFDRVRPYLEDEFPKQAPPHETPPPAEPAVEARILGLASRLTCMHSGHVAITRTAEPPEPDVLTEADLTGASIIGCANVGPGNHPCTRVKVILAGLSRTTSGPDGSRAVCEDVAALTDGIPPGTVKVRVHFAAPARLAQVFVVRDDADIRSRQTFELLSSLLRLRGCEAVPQAALGDGWDDASLPELLSCGAGVVLPARAPNTEESIRVTGGRAETEQRILRWRSSVDAAFRVHFGVPAESSEAEAERLSTGGPAAIAARLAAWVESSPLALPMDRAVLELATSLTPWSVDDLHTLAFSLGVLGGSAMDELNLPMVRMMSVEHLLRLGLRESWPRLEGISETVDLDAVRRLVEILTSAWVPAAALATLARVLDSAPTRFAYLEEDHPSVHEKYVQALWRLDRPVPRIVKLEPDALVRLNDLSAVLTTLLPLGKQWTQSELRARADNTILLVIEAEPRREVLDRLAELVPALPVLFAARAGDRPLDDDRVAVLARADPEIVAGEMAALERAQEFFRRQGRNAAR